MNIIIKESKRKEAIEACDKVINGIEDESISALSALLQCKKIARLVNDYEGMEWLGFEYGGYPIDRNGHILEKAYQVAAAHGRQFTEKDAEGEFHNYVFTELCSELWAFPTQRTSPVSKSITHVA